MNRGDKQKYFLYLESYVISNYSTSKVLLLNTLNGEYRIFNDEESISFLNLLKDKKIVEISNKLLKENSFQIFLSKLKNKLLGNILRSINKPINSFSDPIFYNNHYYNKNHLELASDLVYEQLFEITLYLHSKTRLLSRYKNMHKQFVFPIINEYPKNKISLLELTKSFSDTYFPNLRNVNLCGGNLFDYEELQSIIYLFIKKDIDVVLNFHYTDFIENDYQVLNKYLEHKTISAVINIDRNIGKSKLNEFISRLISYKDKIKFHLIISENEEYTFFSDNLLSFKTVNYSFVPYINEKIDFFYENVFFERDQLKDYYTDVKDIYSKKILNQNLYGKLIVLPNLDVRDNINSNKIGNLKVNSIYEMINKSLNSKSWFLTRKKINPCNDCVYNILCPPISNYELYYDKNNFCKEEKRNEL